LEVVVVLIIALVIFGPKRVPELGKSVGKAIKEFQSALAGNEGPEDEGGNLVDPPAVSDAGEPPAEVDAKAAREEASTEDQT
jgi:sec-independent protein translocase protein TatA